ncbi:MAG: hypothetical protein R6V01_00540 [Thermoplasmatota archaeon]
MPKENKERAKGIEVRYSKDMDEEKKESIGSVLDLFQGPLFEQMVRDTVAEFCLEGRLIYDPETDEFYERVDHLKLIAERLMEEGEL